MYAYVAAATGWTWEYIGQCLTLPRLYALQKHWEHYPPAHIMMAIYAGYKPPQKVAASKPSIIEKPAASVFEIITPMDDATEAGLVGVPFMQPRMPQRGQ